jgi:hypothetical protein
VILRELNHTYYRPVDIVVVREYQDIMYEPKGVHSFSCLAKAKNYFGKREVLEVVDYEATRTTRIYLQG